MITKVISDLFKQVDLKWKIKSGEMISPTENDIEIVLDEIAKELHGLKVGDRLSVRGLIVEKRPIGHDVYAFVGNYQ